MDIRIKRTNRILWEFPDVVAIALVEMFPDQAEFVKVSYQERLALLEVERQKGKPQPGLEIKFTVEKNWQTDKIQLTLRCGSEEVFFNGPPIYAATWFGGGKRTPPQEIINEYALLRGDGKPVDALAIQLATEERKEKAKPPKEPSIERFIR
jgi:hypothetical protein